ncbi:MAG TPA: hypothetical protein VGI39_05150 [Polyangiaceae bacterium]|jgi:hypothetical protein
MHSKSTKLVIGALFTVLGALPFTAQARTVGADVTFRPTCLSETFGGIYNGCGAAERVNFNAPIDSTGTYYAATISGQAASAANNVTCWSHGVSENGGTFYQSNTVSLPYYGPSADISLSSVYVPSNGIFNVYCTVNAGGTIHNFRY